MLLDGSACQHVRFVLNAKCAFKWSEIIYVYPFTKLNISTFCLKKCIDLCTNVLSIFEFIDNCNGVQL